MEKETKIIIGDRIVCTQWNYISSSESLLVIGCHIEFWEVAGVMIIVPNAQEPSEEKSDDSKDSFFEELEQVFHHFAK